MAGDPSITTAIERLRADRESGASELVPRAIDILRRALRTVPDGLDDVARAVGQAQPSMAPIWNAALAALRESREPGALDRFERRWRRAGAAMVRMAVAGLLPEGGTSVRVATCSFSGSVLACLRAIGARTALTVSCAEGRPAFEGRRLAAALAGDGIVVELFTDAGLGEVLWREKAKADVVLIGADAVTPAWMLNKAGSGMLAAAAARAGVPVYVAATRDKLLDARETALLQIVEHDSSEVWDGPPPGVTARNTYFERMPIELVSGLITDAGTLAADMVAEACRAASASATDADIDRLRSVRRPSAP